MDWKDVAKMAGKIAPGICAAVGGPAGAVAGMGVKALCGYLGVDDKAETAVDLAATAIQAMTPEQAVELQKGDKQFIKDMATLGVDVFRLEVEDKKSARTAHKDSIVPGLLTLGFFAMAGVIIYFVATGEAVTANKVLWGTVVGYVFSELKQASGYWLGSSMSSKEKTALLGKG